MIKETFTADPEKDTQKLEYQTSDGTYITKITDFKHVSIVAREKLCHKLFKTRKRIIYLHNYNKQFLA